jgi:hypothetical protein
MTTSIESAPAATDMSAARGLAYRRLAAAILRLDVASLAEDLQRNPTGHAAVERLVVGRAHNGAPRTYRLVRRRRAAWPVRLARAVRSAR